jgi:hypothetical protein
VHPDAPLYKKNHVEEQMNQTIKIATGLGFLAASSLCQAATLLGSLDNFLSFQPLQGALVTEPADEFRIQLGYFPYGTHGSIDLFAVSASPSNVDQVFTNSSGAAFNAATAMLTNGDDNAVYSVFYAYGIPHASAAGYESMIFGNDPGSTNGIDFAGSTITGFELIVHQINGSQYEASYTFNVYGASPVPVPPAIWLLGSGLIALAGLARRKKPV